jgi:hypothetical protein
LRGHAGLIALASVAALVAGVSGAALVLEGEGAGEADRVGQRRPPERSPPGRCPPPGPAVSLPDGRTLCGRRARRYVERRTRRQTALQEAMYGFSAARKRQARRILARDPTLDRLIGGRRRRPTQLGPWTREGGSKAIGAFAAFDLRSPIEVDGVLPYVCQVGKLRHGRVKVRIRHVARLHALMHFGLDRVVQVDPSSGMGGPRTEVVAYEPLPGSPRCPRRRD